MEPGLTLVVPPPLRRFLPASKRGGQVTVPVDGSATVGHLLAATGIPKTEVGELRLAGRRIGPEHRPGAGDRVEVGVATRPQPTPTSPPRFVLDVHLGALARRMRLLGLDTTYQVEASDEALLETSLSEQRVLLTRDRGLLHRRALRWGAHVDHQRPDQQLHEVVDRFEPPLDPWTRCPTCNGALQEVAKSEVEALLPAGTRRCYHAFHRCTACGKPYWHGAHGDRLQAIVDSVSR